MSGTIVDMPLRVCCGCRKLWIEDDRMYLDPQRCPCCGAVACECELQFPRGSISTLPAGAWELNEGGGYFELNEGGGYFETNE